MSLYVHFNGRESAVLNDLRTICGTPSDLRVDDVPFEVTDPAGKTSTYMPTGRVSFGLVQWPPSLPWGYSVVRTLAQMDRVQVTIFGETADFRWGTKPDQILIQSGGVTSKQTRAGTTLIQIRYDVKNCGTGIGRPGYTEIGTDGGSIDAPTDVALFHELIHAWHHANGTMPADSQAREIQAVIDHPGENDYRAERGLPLRNTSTDVHAGSPNCQLPTGATPQRPPPATSSGPLCFVATAAFGTSVDPLVEQLRRLRDDVLLKTRSGSKFFERFYAHYYRFSPAIAQEMYKNREIREAFRIGLVEPIIHFLDFALAMPDAAIDDLPEPWLSYIKHQQNVLSKWASQIDLPSDLAGCNAIEAATELGVILRYVLRSPDARKRWLGRLKESGTLPLRGSSDELRESSKILRAYGRPASEIDAICGTLDHALMLFGRPDESDAPFDPSKWFYTVTFTNDSQKSPTPGSVDMRLFYKRKNQNGVVYREILNILPDTTVVFALCPCDEMESYAFGLWTIGTVNNKSVEYLFDSMPPLDANGNAIGGPIVPGVDPPYDIDICEDSWGIDTIPSP